MNEREEKTRWMPVPSFRMAGPWSKDSQAILSLMSILGSIFLVKRRPLSYGVETLRSRVVSLITPSAGEPNQARPHQGIRQQIPELRSSVPCARDVGNQVIALPVLGGLHHDYRWVA
jgi:hypothetical protein